jgi:hypothetical protein
MGFNSFGTPGTPQFLGSTGINGFALQNATPTILAPSWVAPNDGNMHRILIYSQLVVSSTETGGIILVNFTDPSGTARARTLFAGTLVAAYYTPNGDSPATPFNIAPNTGISIVQNSALSAGAATFWAEIWGS